MGDYWGSEEQRFHFNEPELLAMLLALKKIVRSMLIKSDNMTAVAHINNLGNHSFSGSDQGGLLMMHGEKTPVLGKVNVIADDIFSLGQDQLDPEFRFIPRNQQGPKWTSWTHVSQPSFHVSSVGE